MLIGIIKKVMILNIVIFSPIRWKFLWQRPQQIASRLAHEGHNIVFLQYPYTFTPSTLIENYFEKNTFLIKRVLENLHVVNMFIPPFRGKLVFFAKKLGLLLFRVYLKCLNFEPKIAIFYSLSHVFLLDALKTMNVKILYDCVDEHSGFSGIHDVSEVLMTEEYLITNSDIVIATSKNLCEKISKINSNCFYVPNAADLEHFNSATHIMERPREIKNLKHPIIGFIGAIWDWIDIDLLCKLAELHPEYSILLVGPVNYGLDMLKQHPNIMMVGAKPYKVLPQYLFSMDVCLIPFKINKLTLSSNPIKLYEYLAAGKPVVSTALPEICENASHVVLIARDDEDFIKKVEEAVKECQASENKAAMERRINFARNNSWKQRVETIEKLLKKVIST